MKRSPGSQEVLVPFGRVAKFIRQLTHDVRNGLSAVDLEAAYIAEIVTDPEVVDELRKLRTMVGNTAKMLRDLSQDFQPVTVELMPWQAAIVFEEMQSRLQKQFPEEFGSVDIEGRLDGESIQVDLEQFIAAVLRVVQNAIQFRQEGTRIKLACFVEAHQVVFEVREPKPGFETPVAFEEWGVAPLFSTRPGGYGLGLYRVKQLMDAHQGGFSVSCRDEVLVIRMTLPVAAE